MATILNMLGLILLLATSIAANTSMAQDAGTPSPANVASQLEAGKKIYNFRCYFCHGYSGDAKTVAASLLFPPPVDFTHADASRFTSEYIVSVLQNGKPGTAMQAFRTILTETQMQQVAAFVVDEFISRKASNTRYHTVENGWPDHQRYQAAFPFATGEMSASQPWESLSTVQANGKRLFLSGCQICHDRGGGNVMWEARALSYPRNHYSHTDPPTPVTLDAMTSASPYLLHDIAPQIANMTEREQRGQKLFQDNCAFCHAADGTGKNWIGSFLEPHPRNLRDPAFMRSMTRTRLAATISEGLPNTSMPAWKSVFNAEDIAAVVAYVAKAFHPLSE